jgi:uncharacterized protein with HEPN domain
MADEAGARRDASLMLDMMIAAEDAISFVRGLSKTQFMASRLHQNAVVRSLEIVGEAAGRISAEGQAGLPDVAWREITGMRHRLVHGYSDVNLGLVWDVAREKLPQLVEILREHVPRDIAT